MRRHFLTLSSSTAHTHAVSVKSILYRLERKVASTSTFFERGYPRDWIPEYSFVLRARAIVLTGERTKTLRKSRGTAILYF
jgi:hypothetical protein